MFLFLFSKLKYKNHGFSKEEVLNNIFRNALKMITKQGTETFQEMFSYRVHQIKIQNEGIDIQILFST